MGHFLQQQQQRKKMQLSLDTPDDLPGAILEQSEEAESSVCARRLLGIVAILIVFGLTMLYSTSYNVAGLRFFKFQILWVLIGSAAGFAAYFFGYRRLTNYRWLWWIAVFLMLIVAVTCYPPINGAYRWIKIKLPGFSMSIQPSELAKIVVAISTARFCADNLRTFNDLNRFKGGMFQLAAILAPIVLGILIGHDLGTTVLVSLTAFCIMLAAGLRLFYLSIPAVMAVLGGIYIYFCDPMRRGRVLSFLDPERYASDIGYQLWNSLLALGSGGWCGIGFMESRLKQYYLPESHTDFILAIVGEELGLIALLALIVLYGFFTWCGVKISLNSTSRLGMLLGFGLTCFIAMQAVINISVISGAAPTKGMPAPFISYGGSNMMVCLIAVGLLLSIAEETASPGYTERNMQKLRELWQWVKIW